MTHRALTFPLHPRRRVAGQGFGAMRSRRFGAGFDLAGSRPYAPGDDVRRIDWRGSARLSSLRGQDEFVVREMLAEHAGRVVAAVDRSPGMSVCPPGYPWLRKPVAAATATAMVVESAREARCAVDGLVEDPGSEAGPHWLAAPGDEATTGGAGSAGRPAYTAPPDTVERMLRWLAAPARRLSAGTFVFVLSDFLGPPPEDAWVELLVRGLDPVPVVIQDPLWERTFPAVAGAVLPVAGEDGRLRAVRLSRREVEERRSANEARFARLLDGFERLGITPALVGAADPGAVLGAFLEWSQTRRLGARLAR